jgi:hypothetical protein
MTDIKIPTPAEIQKKIYKEQSKKEDLQKYEKVDIVNNETIDINKIINSKPFLLILDDGKQVSVHTNGFSKPAIIGLLYMFLEKFRKEAE